ncbi:MAG: PQQ-binding-like beta-propeller repeat protein [bacterium]|nr:PQQ-binding-like beta-propeller repeat protein [bacterium]
MLPHDRPVITAILSLALFATILQAPRVAAEDWPTYRHDIHRSGVTSDEPRFPLTEAWRHTAPQPPSPAWPAPAQANRWGLIDPINPMVTYDRAYHVIADEHRVYFGSSSDDQIRALDVNSGETVWSAFTDAPVRLAPVLWKGNLYVGSDDGLVYCFEAATGAVRWVHDPWPEDDALIGNGRVISRHPIRTGLVVDDSDGQATVYACAGFLPNEGVRLLALRADDGSVIWTRDLEDMSPQGYLLASPTRLYSPLGRLAPVAFNRANGEIAGKRLEGDGGTFALLIDDALAYGPGSAGNVGLVSAEGTDRIARFRGHRLVVHDTMAYILQPGAIVAMDRAHHREMDRHRRNLEQGIWERNARISAIRLDKGNPELTKLRDEVGGLKIDLRTAEKELAEGHVWKHECPLDDALILAGDSVIAGGKGEVGAFGAADGAELWRSQVQGRAYALAVAHGRLYVSTDAGIIYCFTGAPRTEQPKPAVEKRDLEHLQRTERANAPHTLWDTLAREGIDRGFALVVGTGVGDLVKSLATRTELRVVGLERDEQAAVAARSTLAAAGLYGARASIAYWDGETALPHPPCFANVLVCVDEDAPVHLLRFVRPDGGIAFGRWRDVPENDQWQVTRKDGWAIILREPLPGAGSWPQMYANATNTTCSNDQLASGPARVQWFGRPGPRHIVDRHHRSVSPLYARGRLLVPGDNRLTAVDAYNGTPLWDLEVPHSRRLGAPFDTSNLVLVDGADGAPDWVYFASGNMCRVLEADSGRQLNAYPVPRRGDGETRFWGYTAVWGDCLLGSTRRPEAVYANISWAADAYQWGDFKKMVLSETLFCMDRRTGTVHWTYEGGSIINPSISTDGDRVYFVESLSPDAAADPDGLVAMRPLLKGSMRVVALDMTTGAEVWSCSPDLSAFEQVLFTSCARGTLLLSGSRNVGSKLWQILSALDAATGEAKWNQEAETRWHIRGTHGEQTKHAVIVGETVYAEPFAYDLETGVPRDAWTLKNRRGCGTLTASANALFFRDANPGMYDIEEDAYRHLNRVSRTGCWVNIIPAGGLVLVPEGSSGCTCAYPLQTSFAFMPDRTAALAAP